MPKYDFDSPDDVLEQITQDEPAVETLEKTVDEEMSEAERRFAKAQYHRTIINAELFDNDFSDLALEVAQEYREFARQRLKVLLGVESEKPTSNGSANAFTQEETKVLKQLVAKLLKKPELAEPKEPSFKPVQGPTAPTTKVASPRVQTKPLKKTEAAPAQPKPRGRLKKTVDLPDLPEELIVGDIKYKRVLDENGEHLVSFKQRDVTENGDEIWREPKDKRKYSRAIDKRGEHFIGPEGQKFIIAGGAEGALFWKNVSLGESRASGPNVIRPVPRLNSTAMAMVAAAHAKVAENQDPVASGSIFSPTSVFPKR